MYVKQVVSSSNEDFSSEDYNRKYGYERVQAPRNVDSVLADFGPQMAASLEKDPSSSNFRPLPQLAEFRDPVPPVMRLFGLQQQRQANLPDSSDDEVRCIPKVMQVS